MLTIPRHRKSGGESSWQFSPTADSEPRRATASLNIAAAIHKCSSLFGCWSSPLTRTEAKKKTVKIFVCQRTCLYVKRMDGTSSIKLPTGVFAFLDLTISPRLGQSEVFGAEISAITNCNMCFLWQMKKAHESWSLLSSLKVFAVGPCVTRCKATLIWHRSVYIPTVVPFAAAPKKAGCGAADMSGGLAILGFCIFIAYSPIFWPTKVSSLDDSLALVSQAWSFCWHVQSSGPVETGRQDLQQSSGKLRLHKKTWSLELDP